MKSLATKLTAALVTCALFVPTTLIGGALYWGGKRPSDMCEARLADASWYLLDANFEKSLPTALVCDWSTGSGLVVTRHDSWLSTIAGVLIWFALLAIPALLGWAVWARWRSRRQPPQWVAWLLVTATVDLALGAIYLSAYEVGLLR